MMIYRLSDVLAVTGLSKSTVYRYMAQGSFPKPIKLASEDTPASAVGWTEDSLHTWVESLEEVNNA